MGKLFIIAFGVASLGAASLGASFVPPAFGTIEASMQKKAERDLRDRLSERSNLSAVKTESSLRTVPYGTGVYKLVP
jgi:hypothetical protein